MAELSPATVLEQLKKNGATHVVWLPDSETNFLYVLMSEEPSLDLVPVSREGHAFSTAAGLAAGGKKPVILIQNTGMMESGDSLRGWGLGMNVPGGDDGGLSRLDAPRRHQRHGGLLHRTVPARLQHQLLPGGVGRGRRPHFHRLCRGAARTRSRWRCWWATNTTGST